MRLPGLYGLRHGLAGYAAGRLCCVVVELVLNFSFFLGGGLGRHRWWFAAKVGGAGFFGEFAVKKFVNIYLG